jgi:TRAP-type uncharacterized transport system substrate-binding protein
MSAGQIATMKDSGIETYGDLKGKKGMPWTAKYNNYRNVKNNLNGIWN